MLIALGASGVWLLGLTICFFWLYRFLRKLIKDTDEGGLTKILTKILKVQKDNSLAVATVAREIKRLEVEGKSHVQKIGIMRFNPFKEIGGDHSFSLAILDGENSGVIVTCLHTRERTRVYMKPIRKGRCELELSAEEKKALEKAE